VGKVHVVEGARDGFARFGVDVRVHARDAIVGHLLRQVGVELLFGDVGPLAVGDGAEGVLDLLGALHVLCLLADHEGHVLLQRHVAVAVRIDDVDDLFELGVHLSLLDHGKVVTQSAQTRLEFLVVQPAVLLLVKVPVKSSSV